MFDGNVYKGEANNFKYIYEYLTYREYYSNLTSVLHFISIKMFLILTFEKDFFLNI